MAAAVTAMAVAAGAAVAEVVTAARVQEARPEAPRVDRPAVRRVVRPGDRAAAPRVAAPHREAARVMAVAAAAAVRMMVPDTSAGVGEPTTVRDMSVVVTVPMTAQATSASRVVPTMVPVM